MKLCILLPLALAVGQETGPMEPKLAVKEEAEAQQQVNQMRQFGKRQQIGSLVDDWQSYMKEFIPDFMLTVYLSRQGSEVFYQDVDSEPTLVRGAFFTSEDAGSNLTVKILDPNGDIVFSRKDAPEGVFVFETEHAGIHSFELSNGSLTDSKAVTFMLGAGQTLYASQTDVQSIETRSLRLLNILKAVERENSILFSRQQDHLQVGNVNITNMGCKNSKGIDVERTQSVLATVRPSIKYARVNSGGFPALEGAYHVSQRVLGTGISGSVKLVTHKKTGQQFAMKHVTLGGVGMKRDILENEVLVFLEVDHPNICRLLEVYEEPNSYYLVMEYCTGGELYNRLAKTVRFTERDVARLTVQMLKALKFCHDHHICHRDLKLENWVFQNKAEDSPLKLIDFGFSKLFDPGRPMTAVHGTVYYVAPEVLTGYYTYKCDMWSVGVIVYMMLSGAPPFSGSEDSDVMAAVMRGEYQFAPVARWQGVSQEAKDFISRLLVLNPSERFGTSNALTHPWILNSLSQESVGDVVINRQHFHDLQQFSVASSIKRAALGVVAFQFPDSDVHNLQQVFTTLDSDMKGYITFPQFCDALKSVGHITTNEARNLFEKVDQTGDNRIYYSEFIAVALQAKLLENESLLRQAFDKFDRNRDGVITLQDMKQSLGDTYDNRPTEDIFNEALDELKARSSDKGSPFRRRRNTGITWEEFARLVRKTDADISLVRKRTSELQVPKGPSFLELAARTVAVHDHEARAQALAKEISDS